jgi:hypothetical protein
MNANFPNLRQEILMNAWISASLRFCAAFLLGGCANGPPPEFGPSLPPGEFIVILRGDSGSVSAVRDEIDKFLRIDPIQKICQKRAPTGEPTEKYSGQGLSSSDTQRVAYDCNVSKQKEKASEVAQMFVKAYGQALLDTTPLTGHLSPEIIPTALDDLKASARISFTNAKGCAERICWKIHDMWTVDCKPC